MQRHCFLFPGFSSAYTAAMLLLLVMTLLFAQHNPQLVVHMRRKFALCSLSNLKILIIRILFQKKDC